MRRRGQCIVVVLVILASGREARTAFADDSIDSAKSVRSIFSRRCVACHNSSDRKGGLDLTQNESALAGGESGRVIDPGHADESLLWQYVSSGEMPPKKPLPDDEQKMVHRWIQEGAKWTGDAIDPYQSTTEYRAGYDWWSLQPLKRTAIPQAAAGPNHNAIDHFISANLADAQLAMSPGADRRALIRRLYADLLGLLPTPAEVDEFVDDHSRDAYEQLVDRVLASPQYGERWARHWLDVARFGESQGFERDKLRPNSWPYRDWLINALNADLSYQEFARLQIAGDVLHPDRDSAAIATGFLVAGPYDEVGQQQQSEAMRQVVREDELEDLVSTVAQTFLGLTVNCARCHDHKFDPIRQTEYYRLCASLAGVRHGERTLEGGTESIAAALSQISARTRSLERQLNELEDPVREQLQAERVRAGTQVTLPKPIAEWQFDNDLRDSIGELHATAHDGATLSNGRLIFDGRGYAATVPLRKKLTEKTLEAWVSLADLQQQGGGVIGVQTLDGKVFDAIVFGELESQKWIAGSNFFERTKSFEGPPESNTKAEPVHIAIVYREDGTIAAFRNGQPYGKPYRANGKATFPAEHAQIIFGLRHGPPGGNKLLRGSLDRARLYDRALTDDEIAASAGTGNYAISDAQWSTFLDANQAQSRTNIQFELQQLREHQTRLRQRKTYAVTPKPIPVTYVLLRGNPANRGAVALPGGIAALSPAAPTFSLEGPSTDEQRRGQLAGWITDASNPLFARVMVNRLWHYHFGVGLVDTPNDFGFNGGRPTHPELLDWLAAELIRCDWSIKHVQRLIVLSATYRQSSRWDESKAKVDADNRLLWRKSPHRLEAESLRDIMLELAGELNETMFGPGYYDFTTFVSNSQFYEMVDPIGTTFQRRSIYRTWLRSGRNPLLDVFDCPDPSTKTPQRAVTTTPLQALSLLNNSFVLRVADQFAGRIQHQAGDDPNDQLTLLFRCAYGRRPDEFETHRAVPLIKQYGLPAMCRVVLNSSELLYVD